MSVCVHMSMWQVVHMHVEASIQPWVSSLNMGPSFFETVLLLAWNSLSMLGWQAVQPQQSIGLHLLCST